MTKGDKYLKQIEAAAGNAPAPLPDAKKVFTSIPAPIPPRRSKGYQFSKDGLILQRPLTREEFRDGVLVEIEAIQSAQQLIVGDAYLHGIENGYIESYEEMALLTGYTAGSIEVYASVCRNIPQLTRVNSLKFKHYQVIARLSEDERPHWISFAASNKLGYRMIEALIADVDANPQLPAGDDPESDRPALSDEMAAMKMMEEEARATPDIAIKEVKKQLRAFVHHVETDTLQAMPQDDLYLLMIYVQRKYAERKKLGK